MIELDLRGLFPYNYFILAQAVRDLNCDRHGASDQHNYSELSRPTSMVTLVEAVHYVEGLLQC